MALKALLPGPLSGEAWKWRKLAVSERGSVPLGLFRADESTVLYLCQSNASGLELQFFSRPLACLLCRFQTCQASTVMSQFLKISQCFFLSLSLHVHAYACACVHAKLLSRVPLFTTFFFNFFY